MIYTVTFHNIAEDREDFSVFATEKDARDFIESRHQGYGENFVITEESEDGQHSAII